MSNSSKSSSLVRIHLSHLVSDLVLIPVLETYGYYPEAITVLRDDPDLSDHFQPTRVNMVIQPYLLWVQLRLIHTTAS
jgi:hypothetical protein